MHDKSKIKGGHVDLPRVVGEKRMLAGGGRLVAERPEPLPRIDCWYMQMAQSKTGSNGVGNKS